MRLFPGEASDQFAVFVLDAFDVRHQQQFFRFQLTGDFSGDEIGVDIQCFPIFSATDGGDDRDELRPVERVQDIGVDPFDVADQAEVDDLRPVGFGTFFDLAKPFGLDQIAVLAGDADGVAAVPIDEGDDVLVDLAAQYHFHHVDHFFAGDALAVDEFRLNAEQLQRFADLRSAAVDNDGVDADVFHHHYVQCEVVFQLLGDHGAAAVFDNQGLVVKPFDEGEGFDQDFRFLDAFFHRSVRGCTGSGLRFR